VTSTTTRFDEERREFLRERLRSDFVSMFWSAIEQRKLRGEFKMQQLADALGRDKSVVSKWFSNEPSNWQLDTIADIADALDLEIAVTAKERHSHTLHTPYGMEVDHAQIISTIVSSGAWEFAQVKPVERAFVEYAAAAA
jgi:hypothetical protein